MIKVDTNKYRNLSERLAGPVFVSPHSKFMKKGSPMRLERLIDHENKILENYQTMINRENGSSPR